MAFCLKELVLPVILSIRFRSSAFRLTGRDVLRRGAYKGKRLKPMKQPTAFSIPACIPISSRALTALIHKA